VGLHGCKVAADCFPENAGFRTPFLLRTEGAYGCKMAECGVHAVGALRDAGFIEMAVEIFLASLYKMYSFQSALCYRERGHKERGGLERAQGAEKFRTQR
jgi:hypothetical protein